MQDTLPIVARKREILEAFDRNQVIVLSAETGAGKTTEVPRFLYEERAAGKGLIGVTQPRKVAAMGVAAYVAAQMGYPLGTTVGYQIRHERVADARTGIKFMTDGILLREIQADPLLTKYRVLVLDEMHERNLNQDFILGLVKRALPQRPDLKVVVMSATINEQAFADYFGAEILRIEGRRYPVEIEYLDDEPRDVIEAAVDAAASALTRVRGDVLVFMPDRASIDKTVATLAEKGLGVEIRPLYGNQSPEEQRRIFVRQGRRIIVATNIAETSITLDGVEAVVDTGLIKQLTFLHGSNMSSLQAVEHSRAGCDQRAGRAGRTSPGLCLRLYSASNYEARPAFTSPEIQRSSLEQVILQMMAMGMDDATIDDFGFLDAPSEEAVAAARATLHAIGATDGEGNLTADGRFMSDIPLPPVVTRMILTACAFGCVAPVVTIAATFSTRDIFVRPQGKKEEADAAHAKFRVSSSDFLTTLKAIEAWRASEHRQEFAHTHFLHGRALEEIMSTERQIRQLLEERGIEVSEERDPALIAKSVASGLLGNLFVHDGGKQHTYTGTSCGGVWIFPGSSLFMHDPSFMVAAAIVETSKTYARMCQAVTREMLISLLPREEVKKEPSRFYVDTSRNPPVLCCEFQVTWNDHAIGKEVLEDLRGPEIRNVLVNDLVAAHGYMAYTPSWHPHVRLNVARVRVYTTRFDSFEIPTTEELAAHYLQCLWGVASVEEALTRDLTMNLDERLSAFDLEVMQKTSVLEPENLATPQERWEQEREQEEGLGELALAVIAREFGACPLCDRKLYYKECASWHHDQRRILFEQPSRALCTLVTDNGQEVAQMTVYKDGRIVLTRNSKLLGLRWTGRPFVRIDVRRHEGLIIPAPVSNLDACLAALAELKQWRAEADEKKAAEAALKKEITSGAVARVKCEQGSNGRTVVRHRGTEYVIPYDAVPYPSPGETWYLRLSPALQRKQEATPVCKDLPSANDEEALVAELLADFRSTYGFVPSGF